MKTNASPLRLQTGSDPASREVADIRAHFALHSIPFTRELPIDKRLVTPELELAQSRLKQAIDGLNLVLLTGPAGSGKSVLLRSLRASLPEARYRFSYLKVTGLGRRDLCRELAIALGLSPAGQFPTLVRRLQEAVQSQLGEALRCVLLIDEAQDIPLEVLPVFRLLTNFDMDSRLLFPIVLSGLPSLLARMRTPPMEALAWRLSDSISLTNLSEEQALTYVAHRMAIAGASAPLFTDQALAGLWELTRGNMRAIDAIALGALHAALADGDSRVEYSHLLAARHRVAR